MSNLSKDYAYDIETYKNMFSVVFVHIETGTRWIFEVSARIDQSAQLAWFLRELEKRGARLFGFNNIHFDWPIVQRLLLAFEEQGTFRSEDAYALAQAIFQSQERNAFTLWPRQRIITQGDLFLIHHFDNMAKSTSLKKLAINMRSKRVQDLPYPPDQLLTDHEMNEVIKYNCRDVAETVDFYKKSIDQINFRDELAEKYPKMGDVLNFNDTKIGKKFFEMKLIEAGIQCYDEYRNPEQTIRGSINLGVCISPKIKYRHPEFERVRSWLSQQQIVETKGVFKKLIATVDGFDCHFGTGGIHGSLKKTAVHEDDEWEIWDWDVASYYPNLAITGNLYPAHLSEHFCAIYKEVYEMRKGYAKKTAENAMLKLALNGVYGDSNQPFSIFYDSQYTMSITLSGQLFLCMLAEWLLYDQGNNRYSDIQLIQMNTDGLTVRVRKKAVEYMNHICKMWEDYTGLELESVRYKSMFIRDVNSYAAVKDDGSIKRIGAYAYITANEDPYTRELPWHKDHSNLVSRKAAEAFHITGEPVDKFIMRHRNPWDFQLTAKIPRTSKLIHGDKQIQNTTRYYVSTDGSSLTKVMPPLPKKREAGERHMSVQAGWTVTITNEIENFRWDNVNWLYYIEEARKLLVCD
jgi:hypothetical protein